MKKLILFAAFALLVSINCVAANFLTFGDSCRFKPSCLDGYVRLTATMTIDGYTDNWQVSMDYPQGLTPKLVAGAVALDGMTIPYMDEEGVWQTYSAVLSMTAGYQSIGSQINFIYGFYDVSGKLRPYGTVKWEPGTHDMFSLNMYVDPSFRAGYITMETTFNSSYDTRGAVLVNVSAYKTSFVWVGYKRGDVGGDERLDVADVTLLIDRILGKITFDEFQEKAADLNGDGSVDIDDVTILTSRILG